MIDVLKSIGPHFNYFIYIILMLIGLWAMIAKNNYIKKLIGMSIFQTAVILFYVSVGVKDANATGEGDATIPIITEQHIEKINDNELDRIPSEKYMNPLPHVLMLTAIVVGVATLGVALAVTVKIYREYETIEESEILVKLEGDE